MAKNSVSQWDSTAANNTDVGGINIAEGCPPSNVNDAMREMMAQLKDAVASKQSDVLDTTTGAGLIVGAFGLGALSPTRFTGDVNSIQINSWRAVDSTATNLPTALQGILRTEMWDNDAAGVQTFFVVSTGVSYQRIRSSGTWQAWYRLWNSGNAIGTVSQSGGVPTGAIVESGSNSNGRYVRNMDGTQICFANLSDNVAIDATYYGGYRSTGITWTFPAEFIGTPVVVPGSRSLGAFGIVVADSSNTTAESSYVYTSVASDTAASRTASLLAIGRWY